MSDPDDGAAIGAVLAELAAAHHARDAQRIAALYMPDALIYDLAPPLGRRGLGVDGVAEWLATWDGPVLIDATDPDLTVSGDLAVATGLVHLRGSKGGQVGNVWFRSTTVLRRTAAGWRIAHDHASVPFHMDGSMRAAVDLSPSVQTVTA